MEEKSNTGSVARLEDNGAVASGDSDTAERIVVTDPLGRYQRTNVLLGRGAYKEVFKAYDQEEGREVAWNQMLVDHLAPADIQQILSEITLLASLRNENIINLFHAWSSPGLPDGRLRVFFITELMSSGTLKAYMKRTGTVSIKPKVLKNWCKQILKGLDYLHSHAPPIIHRDLKCDNIFINGNHGVAKIGDLGMATIKEKEHMSHVIGTPEFMAPELYDEKYDEKVDIYAFGMCVLEMATKEYPYSECTNAAQIFRKVTTGIKPSNLTKVQDHDILTLIEQCIEADPIKRPTAKQLLALPLLITENNSSFGPSSSSNNVGTSAASSAGSNSSNVILNGATKSPSLKPSNVTIVSSQANPVATFSTSSNVSSSHPKSIESSSSNMTASTSNWSVGADDILPPNLIGLNAGLQQQRPSSPLRNTNQSITQMNSGSSITEDSTDVTHNDANTSNSKYGRETSLKRSSSLPARLQVAASPLGSSRTLADVTSPVAEDSEESEQVTQDTGINDSSRQDVIYDNRIQMLKNQNDQSVQRQLAENPGGYLSSQLSQLMMMNTRPGSAPPVSSEDTPTHGGGTPTSSTDNNNNNTNRNLDKVNGNGNGITTIASSSPGSKGVQLVIRDNHIHYSPMMNGSGVSSSRKEHQVASGSSNRSDPASFLDQNRRFCDIEIIPDSDTQRTRQVTMKMTYFANNLAGNTPEGKNAHEIRFPYNLELDTPLLVALEMIREKILPEAELNMAEEKIKSAVDLAMTVLFGNDHPVGVGLMSPPRLTSRTSGIGSGTNVLHEKDGKEGNSATTEVVTNPSLLNDMGKSPDGIAGEVGHLVISSGGSDDIFRRRSLQLSSDKKQLEPSSKTLLDSSKVIINDGNNIGGGGGGGGVGVSSFSGNSNGSNSNGGSTKDSHKLSPRVSRSKSINNSQPGNRRQHRKSSSHVSPSIFDQKQSREPSLLAPNTFTAYTGTPSPLSRNRQPSFGGGGIGSPGSPLANNASALTNNNPIVLHFYRPSRESSSSTNGGVVGVDDKTGPSAIRKGRAYSNENLKSSPIVGTGPGPGNYARGRTPIKASLVKNHRRSKSSFSLPPAFPHNFYGKMSSSLVKSPEAIIDIVPETVGTDNGNGPMKDDPRGGLEADKIDVGEVKGRVGVGGGNIDGSESDKNDRAMYHSDISEAMEEEDDKGVVKDGYEIDTMSEDIDDDDDDEEEDDDGDDEEDEDDGFLAGDDSSFSTSNNTPQRSTKKSSKHLKRKSRSVVSGPGKQRIHSDSRSRDKKRVFDRKSNLNRNLNRSSSRSNNDHDDGDPKVQGDRHENVNVNVNRVESGDRKISGSSGDADHELSSNNQDQVTTTTMVKKPTSQTNENGQVVIHKSNIAGKSDMHSHEEDVGKGKLRNEDVGEGKLRHEAPQPISVSSLRNSHHSPSNSIFPDSSNEPRPPPCLKTATPALLEQESSEKQVSGDVDEKLLEEEKHPEMVALRKQFELRMRSLTQEFEREKQQLLFKLEANSIKTITNSNNALNNNSNTNTQPIGQSKSPSLNTTTTTRRSINDGNLNLALSIGAVASPTSSVSAASDLERQLSELQSKALLSFESEIKSSHTGSTGSSIITATSISGTSNQNIMNQNNHLRSVSVGAISVSVGGAKSLFTSQQVNENSVNPAGDDDGNGDDNGDDNGGHNGDDNGDDNDDHLTTFTNTNTRPSTTPPTS